jgi:two-component SAPR family response regulator
MCSRERAFTVLIVEDQSLIALNIEDIAKRIGGCVVGCAAQLSDALTLVETASWDAALLDLRLAGGEMVYPVAERLQAKAVPFAFVTGWDGDIDRRYSDAPVLRKPFGEVELENCLRRLMTKIPQPASEEQAA